MCPNGVPPPDDPWRHFGAEPYFGYFAGEGEVIRIFLLPRGNTCLRCRSHLQDYTAWPTPIPTFLSTTRFSIDRFNYTFSLSSDEPLVSVGAFDEFEDNLGSARTTAVLFKTPTGNGFPYTPTRCDMLFYKRGGQVRDTLTDFVMTLYADDGTDDHNPGQQVSVFCYVDQP